MELNGRGTGNGTKRDAATRTKGSLRGGVQSHLRACGLHLGVHREVAVRVREQVAVGGIADGDGKVFWGSIWKAGEWGVGMGVCVCVCVASGEGGDAVSS